METLEPSKAPTIDWRCSNAECQALMRALEVQGHPMYDASAEVYLRYVCPHCQCHTIVKKPPRPAP